MGRKVKVGKENAHPAFEKAELLSRDKEEKRGFKKREMRVSCDNWSYSLSLSLSANNKSSIALDKAATWLVCHILFFFFSYCNQDSVNIPWWLIDGFSDHCRYHGFKFSLFIYLFFKQILIGACKKNTQYP